MKATGQNKLLHLVSLPPSVSSAIQLQVDPDTVWGLHSSCAVFVCCAVCMFVCHTVVLCSTSVTLQYCAACLSVSHCSTVLHVCVTLQYCVACLCHTAVLCCILYHTAVLCCTSVSHSSTVLHVCVPQQYCVARLCHTAVLCCTSVSHSSTVVGCPSSSPASPGQYPPCRPCGFHLLGPL